MQNLKISVGLWGFAPCIDRFATKGYKSNLSLEEVFSQIKQIKHLSGVELMYPGDFQQRDNLNRFLRDTGLKVSNVMVDTFSNPKWRHGALTHQNQEIRRDAFYLIEDAVQSAKYVDCGSVTLWLGQDGFDYPFQVDYIESWKLLVNSIKQIAQRDPSVNIGLEYKPKEPRTHSFIAGVGETVLLTKIINRDNVGVVLDFGHALMADENAANSLCLILEEAKLIDVHLNDAYGKWDDDMLPGTVHLWESIEFFVYLLNSNYNGWIGLDIFPYREDPLSACSMAVDNLRSLISMAKKVNVQSLKSAQQTMDSISTQRVIRNVLFSEG